MYEEVVNQHVSNVPPYYRDMMNLLWNFTLVYVHDYQHLKDTLKYLKNLEIEGILMQGIYEQKSFLFDFSFWAFGTYIFHDDNFYDYKGLI